MQTLISSAVIACLLTWTLPVYDIVKYVTSACNDATVEELQTVYRSGLRILYEYAMMVPWAAMALMAHAIYGVHFDSNTALAYAELYVKS